MRRTIIATFCAIVLCPCASQADTWATEFFAIETAKLAKLAPTDASLAGLSEVQLREASLVRGEYRGGELSVIFNTQTFRINARFSGGASFPDRGPASIDYSIAASNDQSSWNLLSVNGAAKKQGNLYVTENWRQQSVTIILRFLNLAK